MTTRRNRWNQRLLASAQIATVVIIAAQAWIYNEQRKLMNSTQTVMFEQADIMKKGLYVNERAYVGVASLSANMKDGQVTVTLENIGKIPADKIRVKLQAMRETKELSQEMSQELSQKQSHISTYYFAPGQQLFPGSLKMPVVVTLKDFKPIDGARILAKTEILFVRGTIEYEDGFGFSNITDFGFEYSPRPKEGWTARSDLAKKTD